jgi:hypothetical protein
VFFVARTGAQQGGPTSPRPRPRHDDANHHDDDDAHLACTPMHHVPNPGLGAIGAFGAGAGALPIFGGGFATAGVIGMVSFAIITMLDSNAYTRRLSPLVHPTLDRISRSYQRQPQSDSASYTTSSHHNRHHNSHHSQASSSHLPFDDEITYYDEATGLPIDPTHCTTLVECPAPGSTLNLTLPPNTPHALAFGGLSVILLTLSVHCTRVHNRRDIHFLLQLQHAIHTKETTIPNAARHCRTSEKAITDWMASYDTFAHGPAGCGPEH